MIYLRCEEVKLYDIAEEVRRSIAKSGVHHGLCVVTAHSPACAVVLTVKDDEDVHQDILDDFERIVPARLDYRHNTDPHEAAARTKSALTGPSLDLIVRDGEPLLGMHQGIYLANYKTRNLCEISIVCMG